MSRQATRKSVVKKDSRRPSDKADEIPTPVPVIETQEESKDEPSQESAERPASQSIAEQEEEFGGNMDKSASDSSLKTEITADNKDIAITLPDSNICPSCNQNLKVQRALRETLINEKDSVVLEQLNKYILGR